MRERQEEKANLYADLMQYLFKVDFLAYKETIVTQMLLEDIVRYSSYFIHQPEFLTYLCSLFFGPKALYHP